MSAKKTFLCLLSLVLFFLVLSFFTVAQDNPNESHDNSPPVIDSIDYGENLLDSNETYKKMFESLSEDGEWITASKAQFVREVTAETGENLDSYYPENNEIIYVWRPRVATPNWNPYTNGRWSFCNYGWTWLSNYNWGWGPYNYGRWFWSNFYGWVWIPGRVWAVNWVNWRCNNYYVGWYPTCPQIFWTYYNNYYCNHLFVYYPDNWVFVNKKDFTKKIDITNVINPERNPEILKNTEKVKTSTYVDPGVIKIKYNGPEVKDITKATGQKIYPKNIDIVDPKSRQYAEINNEPIKKVTATENIRENVSKPSPADIETRQTAREESNNKTEPVKGNDPESPPTKEVQTNKNEGSKPNTKTTESKPERKIEKPMDTKPERKQEAPKRNTIEKKNEGTRENRNNNNNNGDQKTSKYYIEKINEIIKQSENENKNVGSSQVISESGNGGTPNKSLTPNIINESKGENTSVAGKDNDNGSPEVKSKEDNNPDDTKPAKPLQNSDPK